MLRVAWASGARGAAPRPGRPAPDVPRRTWPFSLLSRASCASFSAGEQPARAPGGPVGRAGPWDMPCLPSAPCAPLLARSGERPPSRVFSSEKNRRRAMYFESGAGVARGRLPRHRAVARAPRPGLALSTLRCRSLCPFISARCRCGGQVLGIAGWLPVLFSSPTRGSPPRHRLPRSGCRIAVFHA